MRQDRNDDPHRNRRSTAVLLCQPVHGTEEFTPGLSVCNSRQDNVKETFTLQEDLKMTRLSYIPRQRAHYLCY